MEEPLEPLVAPSLKDVFVEKLGGLIVAGKYAPGERLPSERDLATQLGVSRPVVHAGLAELEARGLVTMRPRVGTVVNDLRRDASLATLTALLQFHREGADPRLLESMLQMRRLFEVENARLAACYRRDADLDELRDVLALERAADPRDVDAVTALDFAFHHAVALASQNLVYPMLLRSFEQGYTHFSSMFFADPAVVPVVVGLHEELVEAIRKRATRRAEDTMRRLLDHGREELIARLTAGAEGDQG